MKGIVTGKTWKVVCKRQTSAGAPLPFESGQTLLSAIKETPSGPKLATVSANIIDASEFEVI